MAEAVYLLCSLTSGACAILLFRSYRRNRISLLFWSTFCFAALAVSNVIVFVDLVVVPQLDLAAFRTLVAAVGMAGLLASLIRNSR